MTKTISGAVMPSEPELIVGNTFLIRLKTLATLALLLLVLPLNLTLTAIALITATLTKPFQPRSIAANPQTILISGGKMTKALQLARSFHNAGHRDKYQFATAAQALGLRVPKSYLITNPQQVIDFDFTGEQRKYIIECNPRTHSAITMFYNHPDVAQAYLQSDAIEPTVQPLISSRPTYWTY